MKRILVILAALALTACGSTTGEKPSSPVAPTPPTVTALRISPELLSFEQSAPAEITATGGTRGYTWTPAPGDPITIAPKVPDNSVVELRGTAAGTYNVTVTSGDGLVATKPVRIYPPVAMETRPFRFSPWFPGNPGYGGFRFSGRLPPNRKIRVSFRFDQPGAWQAHAWVFNDTLPEGQRPPIDDKVGSGDLFLNTGASGNALAVSSRSPVELTGEVSWYFVYE